MNTKVLAKIKLMDSRFKQRNKPKMSDEAKLNEILCLYRERLMRHSPTDTTAWSTVYYDTSTTYRW